MFEFNGWIVVRSNEGTPAADQALVDDLREWLDGMLESLRGAFFLPEDSLNGHQPLLLSGLRNHYWHEVEETLRWVAERSYASYGVVHLYDEIRHDGRNAFRVLTLRRGRVTEHDDPFDLM
jgi:hypothetical protein